MIGISKKIRNDIYIHKGNVVVLLLDFQLKNELIII